MQSMYFYHIVITLFTRLLANPDANGDSSNASALRRTVHTSTIADDAGLKLETVLRLYYLRYGFEFWDTCMVQMLAVLAYATLDKMTGIVESAATRDELISSLVFCVSDFSAQSRWARGCFWKCV